MDVISIQLSSHDFKLIKSRGLGHFLKMLLVVCLAILLHPLSFSSSNRVSIKVCKYDDNQKNANKASVERSCHACSSWNAFELRQPEQSEDGGSRSRGHLPCTINARREHAIVDEDPSGPQSGSRRL